MPLTTPDIRTRGRIHVLNITRIYSAPAQREFNRERVCHRLEFRCWARLSFILKLIKLAITSHNVTSKQLRLAHITLQNVTSAELRSAYRFELS